MLLGPEPMIAEIIIRTEKNIRIFFLTMNPHKRAKVSVVYRITFQIIRPNSDMLATDSSAAFP